MNAFEPRKERPAYAGFLLCHATNVANCLKCTYDATFYMAVRYIHIEHCCMKIENEQELVERAKSDQEAFGQLFEYCYQPIADYMLRRVGDVAVAQDLTSVTFIKAWRGLPTYEWRGVPFLAWLYRIANNEVQNHYRRIKLQPASLEELYDETGYEAPSERQLEKDLMDYQDLLERHKDFKLVQCIIQSLPQKYQEVLALRFFEKMTIKDIALITGKKENTVKSLLKRGTARVIRNFHEQKVL